MDYDATIDYDASIGLNEGFLTKPDKLNMLT